MSYEFILPLDKYATSTTNYILGEEYDVNSDEETVFVLYRGAFFTKDLAIINLTTGLPLTIGVDFNPVHHFTTATNKFGNEVMCAISIINPDVRGRLAVNVRYVGGSYQNLVDPLRQLIASLEADGRPVEYGEIIGLPDQFVPAEHLHAIYDTYGYEYTVEAQMAIHDAIVNGSQAAVYEVLTQFDNVVAQYESDIAQLEAMLVDHIGATGNVHLLTRQQLSVDKVPNTGWATTTQALSYTPGYFMDPALTKAVGDQLILQSMNAHLAAPNPHNVSKTTVGLSAVENFGMATLATYNAGTPRGYIDNLVLKQVVNQEAVKYASKTALDNLIADFNAYTSQSNPGGVGSDDVGLGNVNNYGTATISQTIQGTATNLYTTPAGVSAAIAALAPVKSVQGRTGAVTLVPADRTSLGLGNADNVIFGAVGAQSGLNRLRVLPTGLATGHTASREDFVPMPVRDAQQQLGTMMTSAFITFPYAWGKARTVGVSGSSPSAINIYFTQAGRSTEYINFVSGTGSITFNVNQTDGSANMTELVWLFDRTADPSTGSGEVGFDNPNDYHAVKLIWFGPTSRPIIWGSSVKLPKEGAPDLSNGFYNLVAIHLNTFMPASHRYVLQYLGAF